MVLVMMTYAHQNTEKVFYYYRRRKEGYEYKNAPTYDQDYEREILLEEDADDFHAFDYDDLPTIVSQRSKVK